ncbi:hypothetical protein IRJ41_017314 [Triplophysa rosa]|uniref:Uncharacterized protein n=2 Tax=Triplophysa rosa TaxID=992332 RepID=A0A9W7WCW6_TRIRA|nr:hypothetical protein IRJ41_017314 [Triplophysa rosa]
MHQRAEICLPRKKKVLESFHSNTFRIFDETLPERLDVTDVYQNHKYPVRDPQEYEVLKSHNVPHPVNAKFIRTNVRFLNEPVAHMETRHTMAEQFNWWSGLTNQDVPIKAPYSKATTQRCDFQPVKDVPVIRLRESNRPTAVGIIPTISFIDQPDSPLHSGRHMTDPTTSVRVGSQGGGGTRHIPESSGAAIALGRDGKPAEVRENRCERDERPCVQQDPRDKRSHRPRGIRS